MDGPYDFTAAAATSPMSRTRCTLNQKPDAAKVLQSIPNLISFIHRPVDRRRFGMVQAG